MSKPLSLAWCLVLPDEEESELIEMLSFLTLGHRLSCFLCVLPLRLCLSRALALEGFFACLRLSLLSRWNSWYTQLAMSSLRLKLTIVQAPSLRGVGVPQNPNGYMFRFNETIQFLSYMFEKYPKTGDYFYAQNM